MSKDRGRPPWRSPTLQELAVVLFTTRSRDDGEVEVTGARALSAGEREYFETMLSKLSASRAKAVAALEPRFTKSDDPAAKAFFVFSALSLCGDRPPYWVLKWAVDQAKEQLKSDKNAVFLTRYNGLMESFRDEYNKAKEAAKKHRRAPTPLKPVERAAAKFGWSVGALRQRVTRANKALGQSRRRGRPKK